MRYGFEAKLLNRPIEFEPKLEELAAGQGVPSVYIGLSNYHDRPLGVPRVVGQLDDGRDPQQHQWD